MPGLGDTSCCGSAPGHGAPEARATFASLTAREYEDEITQWRRALMMGRLE